MLTENSKKVLEKRYLKRDSEGNVIETCDDMFKRVAKTIASADSEFLGKEDIEKTEKDFYDMMVNLEFLPNSPTLMNAGRSLGQLAACFVLPIDDSMEAIFETVKNAALIHKSGGGTGFSFSRIRQKGAAVSSTGGIASGPISFMKVFNTATEAVKQGGTRRGANMGILRVDHPDIKDFITCKENSTELNNFNISVGLTEQFMEAVEHDNTYELIDPSTKKAVGVESAKDIFDMIVQHAWLNGEPGIVFLDRINMENTVPGLGEIESTNPCGEQPLLPYESCNLGSINLYTMLKPDRSGFDYDKLGRCVVKAVHFLDNVIDVNAYPNEKIAKNSKATRKIGLGVMGWADSLYAMGIPYNSEEALDLGYEVMKFINEESKKASMSLAEIKGIFPAYDKSIYPSKDIKVRNATTTTIAPTGTLSIIAGVSSGIEPAFAISYIRNVMDNTEMTEVNPVFEAIAKERGFYSEELMRDIAKKGTIRNLSVIPEDVKEVFVTSHDIDPSWHVRMQAVFQEHVDNAVSKTVNLRNEATLDDVKAVFMQAYAMGCKGVTLYRDGSRDSQVLSVPKQQAKGPSLLSSAVIPKPRPRITTGLTEKFKTGCGNLYITVNYDENGEICEVFTNTGRAGGCPSQSEATARLVSIALRSGIDTKEIIDQLKGIRCPSTIRHKDLGILSCPDAIGRMIEKVAKMNGELKEEVKKTIPYLHYGEPAAKTPIKKDEKNSESRPCPECGNPLESDGGCVICRSCGYSKCN
ncbi:MAG TPA: vitamin B12-dependent ribonucleotide reductase [Clostridia bacterium]|nr:MAG: Ribonucleoside-diphosphate reductase NrdZ [Firmicutes bacterium ADurb.Bin146]HOD93002.1 vitamin B12-dependent ribonucleotide reductase [Clostridia bacterium]